ncbi:hypothetical protein [Brazilian porcupinepox virus 1]|nr:hypothetical protein [Brazilian porcupinepox virus 1]
MDDTAGSKRRKKRKPKTTINDDNTVSCSSCYSKLVNVSDITKVPFDAYKVAGNKGDILSCATCGSELRLLNGFVS